MGIVFGSVSNEIGFQATGRIPIIPNKLNYANSLLEGWNKEHDWRLLDFTELPYVLNPTQGYIVAANNS
jgi:acyl-homoserine lactone acylase PvdQ